MTVRGGEWVMLDDKFTGPLSGYFLGECTRFINTEFDKDSIHDGKSDDDMFLNKNVSDYKKRCHEDIRWTQGL